MTIVIGIICFVIGFITGIVITGIVSLHVIPKMAYLVKPEEQTVIETPNYEEEETIDN